MEIEIFNYFSLSVCVVAWTHTFKEDVNQVGDGDTFWAIA